ncbi:MAG: hypothetical protein F6K03_09120, partial [Kamptonema sp. SIO4C4]|nr:hypothetical protein [Kamptonema sp. SIO4C4]
MLIVVVVSLTSVFGYRFYNQPRLKEGTIAPKTVWAQTDKTVIDDELTEEQRKAAQTGSVRVLQIDFETTQEIKQDLETFLDQVEQMRQMAGPLPFIDDQQLSLPTQRYLRSTDAEEWDKIVEVLETTYETTLLDYARSSLEGTSPALNGEPLNTIRENPVATNSESNPTESNRPSPLPSPLPEDTPLAETANPESNPDADSNNTEATPLSAEDLEGMSLLAQEAVRELKAYGDSQGEDQ